MKKLVLFWFVLPLCALAQPNSSGTINLNLGLGVSPTFSDLDATSEIAPLHLSVDVNLLPLVSVGGHYNYTAQRFDTPNDTSGLQTVRGFTLFGLRGNLHLLPNNDYIDLYLGGFAGLLRQRDAFRTESADDDPPDPTSPEWAFQPAVHLGVRYRLSSNLSLYAEGSYGSSLFQGGLSLRL